MLAADGLISPYLQEEYHSFLEASITSKSFIEANVCVLQ